MAAGAGRPCARAFAGRRPAPLTPYRPLFSPLPPPPTPTPLGRPPRCCCRPQIAAALRRRGLLAVLPHRGARAFANWGVFKAALEAREAITVALLHAGYVRGGDKERTFRCAQLWPHLPPLPPPGAGAGETS